jgi:hypothetical protein
VKPSIDRSTIHLPNPFIYAARASVHPSKGCWNWNKVSEKETGRALEIEPRNEHILINYGCLIEDVADDVETSREIYRKTASMHPHSAVSHFDLYHEELPSFAPRSRKFYLHGQTFACSHGPFTLAAVRARAHAFESALVTMSLQPVSVWTCVLRAGSR